MAIFKKLDKRLTPHSNLILLVFIFIFIFVIPVFPSDLHKTLGSTILSFILFVSIFTLNTGRQLLFKIAVIAFITEWISDWIHMPVLNYISLLTNVIFFQIIVVRLIIQIAKHKKADAGIIFESINGYLMMGMMFTTWVAIAMLYDPNAFSFQVENPGLHEYSYFTFITLNTLGYGDITPTVPFAKSMAILISTSGQIYVAVIIAMLVGKYAGSQKD